LDGLLKRHQAEGSPGRASLDLNIYLGNLRRLSGDLAGAKANYRAALKELETDASRQQKSADVYSYLALVHCGLGNRKEAFKFAALAVAAKPVSKDALSGAYYEHVQARVRTRLGDRKFAIPAIRRLLTLEAPLPLTPALLRLDPDFDNLRADARFMALVGDH
jgi:tetratricopeptide (TPR) repeat protein